MPSHRLAPVPGPLRRELLGPGGLCSSCRARRSAPSSGCGTRGTAYELFIDEVTYADLALSVARGDGVRLHGEPFHLHPAGFFGTLAVAVRVLGLQGERPRRRWRGRCGRSRR